MPASIATRKPTARAVVTISVPVSDLIALDEAAERTGRTRSALIREESVRSAHRILRKAEKAVA